MDVSGTGITLFTQKVLPTFKPKTKLAITWRQLSSGNYAGLDRGDGSDVYEADVGFYGKETAIDKFIDEIEANRTNPSNVITLDNFFGKGENIFGENFDHSSSISATVLNISRRRQTGINSWGVNVTFRALTNIFTGSSSFPTLTSCDVGPRADSSRTINKFDTYTGAFSYQDHASDFGTFTGVFTLTSADAVLLRNFIRTQRTGDYTLSDTFGIAKPFGSRSANSYPFTVKLIDWSDLGLFGLQWNKFKLTFAEVV